VCTYLTLSKQDQCNHAGSIYTAKVGTSVGIANSELWTHTYTEEGEDPMSSWITEVMAFHTPLMTALCPEDNNY
jgi:hypothetical protein